MLEFFFIVLDYVVSRILHSGTFFKEYVLRAKQARPPQELEFTGPEGPEILVYDKGHLFSKLFQ